MDMEKYVCPECGYVYDPAVGDPEHGIPPGTDYKYLPADWHCPYCGVDKESLKSFDSVMGIA